MLKFKVLVSLVSFAVFSVQVVSEHAGGAGSSSFGVRGYHSTSSQSIVRGSSSVNSMRASDGRYYADQVSNRSFSFWDPTFGFNGFWGGTDPYGWSWMGYPGNGLWGGNMWGYPQWGGFDFGWGGGLWGGGSSYWGYPYSYFGFPGFSWGMNYPWGGWMDPYLFNYPYFGNFWGSYPTFWGNGGLNGWYSPLNYHYVYPGSWSPYQYGWGGNGYYW